MTPCANCGRESYDTDLEPIMLDDDTEVMVCHPCIDGIVDLFATEGVEGQLRFR